MLSCSCKSSLVCVSGAVFCSCRFFFPSLFCFFLLLQRVGFFVYFKLLYHSYIMYGASGLTNRTLCVSLFICMLCKYDMCSRVCFSFSLFFFFFFVFSFYHFFAGILIFSPWKFLSTGALFIQFSFF